MGLPLSLIYTYPGGEAFSGRRRNNLITSGRVAAQERVAPSLQGGRPLIWGIIEQHLTWGAGSSKEKNIPFCLLSLSIFNHEAAS